MKRKLLVYAEQDTATGIWTIDCPELFVIGAQGSGSLSEAISEALPASDPNELEIRDMSGAWTVDYDGVSVPG